MSYSHVGTGTAVTGNNADVTPTLPAHNAGDLLVAVCSFRTAAGVGTVATPAGWTAYTGSPWQRSANTGQINVFYKIASGSDTDPLMDVSGGAANSDVIAVAFALRSSVGTPAEGIAGTKFESAGSEQNIGPITMPAPTQAEGVLIVIGTKADDWTSVALLTGDSLTWTEITEQDATAGTDAGLVVDIGIWTGGAPTLTDKTFTVTGGTAVPSVAVAMTIVDAAAGSAVGRGLTESILFNRRSLIN